MSPTKQPSPSEVFVFETVAGDPQSWLFSASRLKQAADLVLAGLPEAERRREEPPPEEGWVDLLTPPKLANVYVFLAALALENLLKGIRIHKEPEIVREGRLDFGASHDLLEISGAAGVEVSEAETEALREASRVCVSWGRYPTAKSAHRGPLLPNPKFTLESFKRTFELLYARLSNDLVRRTPLGSE